MKKSIKIILIILAIIICIILIDTAQAKLLNNRPILKITEDLDGTVEQKDKGILVYTYVFKDETQKTVFRWEKYAPPEEVAEKAEDEVDDTEVDKNEIPDNYIAVFNGGAGEILYKTYIYKQNNGKSNSGFDYINVTATTTSWGSDQWNEKITKKGSVQWTDDVLKVAEKNNAYSFVKLPNSDKTYTIEEYAEMFLTN